MTAFRDITYSRDGAVAIIALDRPDKLNAVRISTIDEIVAALDLADGDDAVRAVVVTGNGRAFCAGTDLSDGFDLPTGGDFATGEGVPADVGARVPLRIFDMRKPVIAAVNGVAVGFGASLLAAADMRVASREARVSYIFARRGICAESCSSWFLPRLVGLPVALDWMLTGRMVEADELKATGFVRELLEPGQVLARALALGHEIAGTTAAMSVAINRHLAWRMIDAPHPAVAHALESRGVAATLAGPDSKEGAAAFTERRAPVFTSTARDASFVDGWTPSPHGRG